jgi:hypothetical protein
LIQFVLVYERECLECWPGLQVVFSCFVEISLFFVLFGLG